MFKCDQQHTISFNDDELTQLIKEDLLERLSAFHSIDGFISGAFGGNTISAMIDGESTRIEVRTIAFTNQTSIIDATIELSAKAAGSRILFAVNVVEGEGGFTYKPDQTSLRLNPAYRQ